MFGTRDSGLGTRDSRLVNFRFELLLVALAFPSPKSPVPSPGFLVFPVPDRCSMYGGILNHG